MVKTSENVVSQCVRILFRFTISHIYKLFKVTTVRPSINSSFGSQFSLAFPANDHYRIFDLIPLDSSNLRQDAKYTR